MAMLVLGDILSQTFRALWAHKLRTFLTMFGIAWGVGSLLLLVGLGEGFRSGNERGLKRIGENIIFIWPGTIPAVEGQQSGRHYFLTERDIDDIATQAKHVGAIAGVLQRSDIRTVSPFQNYAARVMGVPPQFAAMRNLEIDKGRWINEADIAQRRNVVVLGVEALKQLYAQEDAVGTSVLLNGTRFEVVGVLKLVGRDPNNGPNSGEFVPFSTMQTLFPVKGENVPPDAVSFVNLQSVDRASHDLAREEAHSIIGRNHQFNPKLIEAFDEWDTVKSADTVGKIFTAMDVFLGSVGMVTLALGAIGVINIMLVSVTERTREIGLRKALGATSRNVLMQFCFEGAFLTIANRKSVV